VHSGVVQGNSHRIQPHDRKPSGPLRRFGARYQQRGKLLLPLALTLVADGLLELPALLARLDLGPPAALNLRFGPSACRTGRLSRCRPGRSQPDRHNWLVQKGANCPFIGQARRARYPYHSAMEAWVYQA